MYRLRNNNHNDYGNNRKNERRNDQETKFSGVLSVSENSRMKAVILDGYVDEPACFGVPPYISPYPRYTAGALVDCGFAEEDISYYTIDQIREAGAEAERISEDIRYADVLIIISGMTVPGKYLRFSPITAEEIRAVFRIGKGLKILGGPVRLGYSQEGGRSASDLAAFLPDDVVVARKDVESFVYDSLRAAGSGSERADGSSLRPALTHRFRTTDEIARWSKAGAFIIRKHPLFPDILCELETYRGCGRRHFCSFCTEPFYGRPDFRKIEDVIAETKCLYENGARHFRIGRQPDLFGYMGIDDGGGILRPDPDALEALYSGIRRAAPDLLTLHMDNGNPITIATYPEECLEILKTIVKYHTPGDVIAMGLESADPAVIEANGLKASPEEVLEAIRLVNSVGAVRGENGMPEILPGINLVHGLIGETKATFRLNEEFLKKIYDEGLMLRRINIRQVITFPKTAMEGHEDIVSKNNRLFRDYKEKIRKEIDLPMLRRTIPAGTVLKNVYTEVCEVSQNGNPVTFARQFGTYPILVGIPGTHETGVFRDLLVTGHGYRSITAVPYPLPVNTADVSLLKELPGLNRQTADDIILKRPFKDGKDLEERTEYGKLIAKYVSFDRFRKRRRRKRKSADGDVKYILHSQKEGICTKRMYS